MKRLMRWRKALTLPDTAPVEKRPRRTRLLVQHGLSYQRYEGTCESCGKVMGGLFMVSPETGVPVVMECWGCSRAVQLTRKNACRDCANYLRGDCSLHGIRVRGDTVRECYAGRSK